ncbi:MAG TPA: zinc ribbon domain-containing protein [Polyangiaceae bacterium]|jgi:hypothetical protein
MANAQEQPQPSSPLSQIDTASAGIALSAITIVLAVAVGFVAGIGMSLLTILTGALLGAILLVWHSLRTLAGDADVPPELEAAVAHSPANLELFDEKTRLLRALKDIEQENALGKIDDDDFKQLDAEYRALAKDAIRALDESVAPYREKAEALVRDHLEKHPVAKDRARDDADEEDDVLECPKCETENDPDAAFCKKCGEKLA